MRCLTREASQGFAGRSPYAEEQIMSQILKLTRRETEPEDNPVFNSELEGDAHLQNGLLDRH